MSKQFINNIRQFLVCTAAAASLGLMAAPAQANYVATFDGTDCSGVFGQGFANCKIPLAHDPEQSPVIIKFNFTDDKEIGNVEINTALFPTIDGSEFSITNNGAKGSWTYTRNDDADPFIEWFVSKYGNQFDLYGADDTAIFSGSWSNQTKNGISHLTFYDSAECDPAVDGCGPAVPEPGSLMLIGAGVLGYALIRRRRTA